MIKDFFKWWYTDSSGNEYMTFSECALSHDYVILLTIILSIIVLIIYYMIGINAYVKSRSYKSSITKTYLINMTNTFILCGICGYGYTVLSVFYNPYKLRVLLLLILVVYSYRFYKSIIKTNIIESILKRERSVEQTIINYNKTALKFQREKPQIVSWETLKSFKLYDWIQIEGIRFMKIYDDSIEMVFITEMEANARFGTHFHDCSEHIEILKGELIDDLNNFYKTVGETHFYKENQEHAPYCVSVSSYKVIFKKVID